MPLHPYIIDPIRLKRIVAAYETFRPPTIGYGTVRDFSESVDTLPELATINRDLKDVQRPWMLKAILGSVPRGSRLLEIGAGDPHVAHWLTAAGYEVWIFDPYDGSGHGPTDFHYYREHFPSIRIRREVFTDELAGLAPRSFDCIYSISVLEHIPHDALVRVVAGIRKYQKSGAKTIHAVDYVMLGRGDQHHLKSLELLASGFALQNGALEAALASARDDVDTYFLSAESHNMWRSAIPYEDFPMRRCISVQFCTEIT